MAKNKYNILIIFSIIFFIIITSFIFYTNYSKIPSFEEHITRNKYNIFPKGEIVNMKDDKYIDENNIIWKKRGFLNSLLHNPFKNYIFETYDKKLVSSSEVEISKKDFENGKQHFKTSSFNYYSSFNSPISHFFADVLPIALYLSPKYTTY